MESSSSDSAYMVHDVCCTEKVKLPLDSKMQINKNSKYSQSGTLFSASQDASSESGSGGQKQTQTLPSEPSHIVNGDLEKQILTPHNNTDEVLLKSNLNLTAKGEENVVSDLDSSTGVGKAASSGYCTDTSEREDESFAHQVTKPLCSGNSPTPSSSSAANKVQAARPRSMRTRSYGLRSRPKPSSVQVADPPEQDLLPFDIDKLLHCDYEPVTSEEVYLRKLIQQLDSTYTKAVVLVTRLEVGSPLWRKYLSK